MSDSSTPQDSAAMSPASAGSKPVAWSVDWDGEIDCDFVYRDRESAMEVIADNDDTSGVVVPLYREPRPTLTDEEREVLESLVFVARLYAPERTAGVIQRLLERLGKVEE